MTENTNDYVSGTSYPIEKAPIGKRVQVAVPTVLNQLRVTIAMQHRPYEATSLFDKLGNYFGDFENDRQGWIDDDGNEINPVAWSPLFNPMVK